MYNSLLTSTLEHYQSALDSLDSMELAEQASLEDQVLRVLLARQSVQVALQEKHSVPSASCIKLLKEQDDRLKSYRDKICKAKPLSSWKKLINPPETAWW